MSQDETISRKEKKAQRDADRKKTGKKRKHDEVEDAKAVEKSEFDKDFLPLDSGAAATNIPLAKSEPKTDKLKKRKANQLETPAQSKAPNEASKLEEPKRKKQKKSKTNDATSAETPVENAESSDKSHRFILFVGNLPYSATDTTLKAHFKKLEPFTLRHRTDPKTGKSKGFAFLEFEKYDRMKTCMKLYHHSMFDPNKTTADDVVEGDGDVDAKPKNVKASKGARRINVELTSGGGGKSEGRKEKIRAKNERLGEQRQRRAEAERKEREKKAKEEGDVNGVKPVKKEFKKAAEQAGLPREEMGGMHPSRLARIAA